MFRRVVCDSAHKRTPVDETCEPLGVPALIDKHDAVTRSVTSTMHMIDVADELLGHRGRVHQVAGEQHDPE